MKDNGRRCRRTLHWRGADSKPSPAPAPLSSIIRGRREATTVKAQEFSHARPLIGQQLLSVEKADYTWLFKFTDDIVVATESIWRLIDEDCIVVASEDHGHAFGLPEPVDAVERVLARTVGRSVEAAGVSRTSGDLTIKFGKQAHLQLLQVSCGYESWRLCVDGSETICAGGGAIARFPRN